MGEENIEICFPVTDGIVSFSKQVNEPTNRPQIASARGFTDVFARNFVQCKGDVPVAQGSTLLHHTFC